MKKTPLAKKKPIMIKLRNRPKKEAEKIRNGGCERMVEFMEKKKIIMQRTRIIKSGSIKADRKYEEDGIKILGGIPKTVKRVGEAGSGRKKYPGESVGEGKV
jgi:hypothetical protein